MRRFATREAAYQAALSFKKRAQKHPSVKTVRDIESRTDCYVVVHTDSQIVFNYFYFEWKGTR